MWKELARRGHEISSHSWSHMGMKDIKDPKIYQRQLVDSKQFITEKTGIAPLTFAYAGCAYDEAGRAETLKHYVLDRAGAPHYGHSTRYKDTWTPEQAVSWIDNTIKKGGWHVALMHCVGRPLGYRTTPVHEFKVILDHLKSREESVWVDTYANVALYQATRDRSTLNTLERNDNSVSFTLKLKDPFDEQFPLPYLTVSFPCAQEPGEIQVECKAPNLAYYGYWKDGRIFVSVPPSRHPVRVNWK
jgi:hypothetical protein